jgi:hypothetical protein
MVGRTIPSPPVAKNEELPKLILTFSAGLNENQSPDINEASYGFNFELGARQSKLIPRAPFDLIGTTPNGEPITGIMQMITRAEVKTQIVASGTEVYAWTGGSTITPGSPVVVSSYDGVVPYASSVLAEASIAIALEGDLGVIPAGTIVGDTFTYTSGGLNYTKTYTVSQPFVDITFINNLNQQLQFVNDLGGNINFQSQPNYCVNWVLTYTNVPQTAFTAVGAIIAPSLLRHVYWSLHEYLVIVDVLLGNVVQQWNGTTLQALPTGATLTGSATVGSKVITGLSSTSMLQAGQNVSGTGIGTLYNVIQSVDSPTQVTLSLNSTQTTTGVSIIFGVYTMTGNITAGSPVVTNIVSTTLLAVGDNVFGVGIAPSGTANQIASVDSPTQVTLTVASTATGTPSIKFGVGSPFYAKYAVVFLGRVWYFNITCGTATPHMIVASYFNDPTTVDVSNQGGASSVGGGQFATGLEAFYLLTPDLKPINGVSLFQNVLIISTFDGVLFKLTGTDASNFQFVPFYTGSAAVDTESMASIGNDVIYMRKGGNMNLLSSTQYFGDVRSNDISRWIPTTSAPLSAALICYDQTSQKVYIFVGGKVLVLFKDIFFAAATDSAVNIGLSPWSIYTTQHPNNYNCLAATYIQDPTDLTWNTYWGDTYGNIFMMTGTGVNGDGGIYPINLVRSSALIDDTILKPFPWSEQTVLGKVQYRRRAAAQSVLGLSFQWSDEYTTSHAAVNLKTSPGNATTQTWGGGMNWGDGQVWNSTVPTINTQGVVSHQTFSVVGRGNGFYITLKNVTPTNWQIDHVELF